jgi:hypothetical protein
MIQRSLLNPEAGLRGALVLFACVLAGCASFSSINPGDSAQSVSDRVGKPTTVWKNTDGSQLWQYPQGYYAVQCFMVTIGPDQRVQEIHQARSDKYFLKVQQGMSRDDVYRLLGQPRETWYFPTRDEELWAWRYYETTYHFFNVLFDRTQGTVRSVLRVDEILFLDGNRGSH